LVALGSSTNPSNFALIPGEAFEATICGLSVMTIILGGLAVIAASVMITCKPARIFGRALSYSEALSVCWVAYSIFIGVVALYYALKLPLGLPRATNAPATAIAVCASISAILYLGRVQADWNGMVTRSIFGLLILLGIVGGVYSVW
jgi:hypothetical protein